ncbi:uncharacterized protein LOC110008094 isoform X2 [Amborella trichopoda]|uniref:uncharacterized protein LOC110008094 isoform X2 n=1 Tax=Amborella trichopoda TaxID=13333 RepID=UPI0009BCC492|nr:uncharacterized protein LOC110008094 isoform X2 [Amborella trichopoda]|eukprot:XP_020529123.1 uncharacterized protein LOC110008094 isoform X2 [Amborella trichopoda]
MHCSSEGFIFPSAFRHVFQILKWDFEKTITAGMGGVRNKRNASISGFEHEAVLLRCLNWYLSSGPHNCWSTWLIGGTRIWMAVGVSSTSDCVVVLMAWDHISFWYHVPQFHVYLQVGMHCSSEGCIFHSVCIAALRRVFQIVKWDFEKTLTAGMGDVRNKRNASISGFEHEAVFLRSLNCNLPSGPHNCWSTWLIGGTRIWIAFGVRPGPNGTISCSLVLYWFILELIGRSTRNHDLTEVGLMLLLLFQLDI